jgi:hypothetical protein
MLRVIEIDLDDENWGDNAGEWSATYSLHNDEIEIRDVERDGEPVELIAVPDEVYNELVEEAQEDTEAAIAEYEAEDAEEED